ncbi:MAG: hypothetical protein CMA21_02185 [Euryarchaeota archaeon]|nr:hypothetical protein [Euryarchaeota archaeon]|tara:strand:- start:3712 stop:3975 length:264 start_codon:yes stop_codon:yes gene_type:complete
MEGTKQPWIYDPLCWLGLTQGAFIWLAMTISLSAKIAWISFACGGLIGFFIWLTALGYRQLQVAKFTLYGIALNALLAVYSGWLAFG